MLKTDNLKQEDYENLWNTISAGDIWRGEFLNKKKDGTLYWEFASIAPVLDDNGKITHYIAAKEDITERKKMEQDLISSKNRAEESDRLKSIFLATMSHELRTPLNAIIGFSGLISESYQPEEKQLYYGSLIHQNGNKLLSIINDIIDVSMIESSTITLYPKNILIKDIFQKLWSDFSSHTAIQSGEIELIVDLEQTIDRKIFADDERLLKVFNKLIDNALKFSKTGKVEFGCLDLTKNEKITFFVKDSGIGIPKELQSVIFDRFRQVEETYTRSFGGSGLGLAICSKLIDIMDGKIWVESEQGERVNFLLRIPMQK